jgi:hypothetical protein
MKNSECLQHLFGSLTMLSFDTSDCNVMLHDSRQTAGGSNLTLLIKSAAPTLDTLRFRSQAVRHPQLPEMGEHYLEKLFGALSTNHNMNTGPMVFPCLKRLSLGSIILNTPSLMAFLSRQPALESTSFEYVYLATIGYKWSNVASALPPTCTSFYVSTCGHELYRPDSPVAYNHIKPFHPYSDLFPTSSGWQASEGWFRKKIEAKYQENTDRWGEDHAQAQRYNGMSKEQWISNVKTTYPYALFERT